MNYYKFYNWDIWGIDKDAEYDIKGRDYVELIDRCFKYADIMSLRINKPQVSFMNELKRFEVEKPINCSSTYETIYIGQEFQPYKKYYHLCSELRDFILQKTDRLFIWIYAWGFTNPEDPVFYRKDGSIFFESIIHEGECYLYPREDEDVSNIVSKEHWIRYDE